MRKLITIIIIIFSPQVYALTFNETWGDDFNDYTFAEESLNEDLLKNKISDEFFSSFNEMMYPVGINFKIETDKNANVFEITDLIYWSDPNFIDDGKIYDRNGKFKCENYEEDITIKFPNVILTYLPRELTAADKLNNIKDKGILQIYTKVAYLDYNRGEFYRNHNHKLEMGCEIKLKMEDLINLADVDLAHPNLWQDVEHNVEDILNSGTYKMVGISANISFETFIMEDFVFFRPIPWGGLKTTSSGSN